MSRQFGLPLVAAGDVHMHVRSRRRLQDVLTAIRLGKPVAQCGQALFPNAERSLRLRVRLAQLYPPELLAETRGDRRALPVFAGFAEIRIPGRAGPAWPHAGELAAQAHRGRPALAFPGGRPAPRCASLVEHELRLIAELALRAVLPYRARRGQLRPRPGTFSARGGDRRRTRWCAMRCASPRSIPTG